MLTGVFAVLADAPGAPEAPLVSDVLKDCALLTWTPPSDDGGSPLTGYWLERRHLASARWLTVNKDLVDALTLTAAELTDGNEYEFRVSAQNAIGRGPPSTPSNPITAKDPWGKFSFTTLRHE